MHTQPRSPERVPFIVRKDPQLLRRKKITYFVCQHSEEQGPTITSLFWAKCQPIIRNTGKHG